MGSAQFATSLAPKAAEATRQGGLLPSCSNNNRARPDNTCNPNPRTRHHRSCSLGRRNETKVFQSQLSKRPGRAYGTFEMGDSAMATSELQYVVERNDTGLIVRCESMSYGPYPKFQDALEGAVDEAAEACDIGFDSRVLLPLGNDMFEVEWASRRDGYPLPICGRA
jgi:hypothetical protein